MIGRAFNSDCLIKFIERLVKDTERKVFLVLNNLLIHHSKPMKKSLAQHAGKITVFFFASCGPEFYPDKRLNADLKHKMSTTANVRTCSKLLSSHP